MTKPATQVEVGEAFAERVERLVDELTLAIKWDMPSILLAVYRSYFVMIDAQTALAERLRSLGQRVEYFIVDHKQADILWRLSEHPNLAKTVFFVRGLQFGGQAALNSLNIRRDYFFDYRIRAVFWLTEPEALKLPYAAPDFWSWRHRVVEFLEVPDPSQLSRLGKVARDMAWRGFQGRARYKDTEGKIALRESLLAELPKTSETLMARAELCYTLAGLYEVAGQPEKSLEASQKALELAHQSGNRRLEARCENSLAAIYAEQAEYSQAIEAYRRAMALLPNDASAHVGLGNVYRMLGRYDEAMAEYQRAIQLDAKLASPHLGLGKVYSDLGRFEEAIDEFQRSLALDPDFAAAHYHWALILAKQGVSDSAREHLAQAIQTDPVYKERARRDPDFNFMRDDPRFKELVGE